MNVGKREQLLGIAAMAALLLLASDRLIISPLTSSWKQRSARIVELKRSVAQGELLIDREQSIRARWSGMATNTLPTEASAAESQMLGAFDRWSQESRIGINSIRPQWKIGDGYSTLECRVDAFGSLGALTRFLYEIERSSLGLKIDAVEITARDNRGDQLALGVQVSGLQLNLPVER